MRLKAAFSLLLAFALGAILAYGAIRLYPTWRQSQEWGVVVTTFSEGAQLYGLFESKEECLKARKVFVGEYEAMAGGLAVNKDSRTVLLKLNGSHALVTFSCLPLSEIRGLSLVTASGGHRGKE